ncbi:hypothetical protein OXX79_000150 [Metschnikowia pulcherrima]
MGIKDKLKRTSRIFLSDSKEDLTENGNKGEAGAANPEAGNTATTATAEAPEGTNDPTTDNADGTLASSGDQDASAARDATQEGLEPAQNVTVATGEVGGEQAAENGAVNRRSSFKRTKSKSKKTDSGEAKRNEFFQKLLKKFKRPVGVPPKSETKTEAKTDENPEAAENAAEIRDEAATENAAAAAPEISLDPATDAVAESAGVPEAVK